MRHASSPEVDTYPSFYLDGCPPILPFAFHLQKAAEHAHHRKTASVRSWDDVMQKSPETSEKSFHWSSTQAFARSMCSAGTVMVGLGAQALPHFLLF